LRVSDTILLPLQNDKFLFLEARRISGEWVEYDTALKGWKLRVGESVLWGDV